MELEYSATEVRKILQRLFPHRRLVLSQFTFFNNTGVSRPTGETFRRGRRCYRLSDLLSIAVVLALKEEGIPLKNIESVPPLIQENAVRLMNHSGTVRLSGFGETISLELPGVDYENTALEHFLATEGSSILFWSYDVGALAGQLKRAAVEEEQEETVRKAA